MHICTDRIYANTQTYMHIHVYTYIFNLKANQILSMSFLRCEEGSLGQPNPLLLPLPNLYPCFPSLQMTNEWDAILAETKSFWQDLIKSLVPIKNYKFIPEK